VGRPDGRPRVDFYADVLLESPALSRLGTDDPADAGPFWLGLDVHGQGRLLYTSTAKVRRVRPMHRFERYPGMRALPMSTVLGFQVRLADSGTYLERAGAPSS